MRKTNKKISPKQYYFVWKHKQRELKKRQDSPGVNFEKILVDRNNQEGQKIEIHPDGQEIHIHSKGQEAGGIPLLDEGYSSVNQLS